MKTILVPIDFSTHSDNALNFACHMASDLKAKLYILTIQSLPASDDANMAIELINTIEVAAKETLNKKVVELKKAFKYLEISSHFVFGIPSLTIKEYLASNSFDLVIMGTRGIDGIRKLLFGSLAQSISQHAPCPVLIIHDSNHYESIKRMAVAIDLETKFGEMHAMLEKIHCFAALFRAKLNLFNIHTQNDKPADDIQFKLKSGEPIKVEVVHSDSVYKGIEQYCNTNTFELLILTKHNHTFVEQFFNRNVFGEILQNKSIPIMVFQFS